jgi:hypothetical protein
MYIPPRYESSQGLHVDDLTDLLVRDYGLPRTIVESHLGKGVKARPKGKH